MKKHLLLACVTFIFSTLIYGVLTQSNLGSDIQRQSETFAAGTTYYVDCSNGSDAANGTSANTAWKSLTKANVASLSPGDKLAFKRGCIWSGRLKAGWKGTAAAPITIGDYGTGALPSIQTPPSLTSSRVEVTGDYQIIENLDVRTINTQVDPNCRNQRIGYFVGFNFIGTSANNILRNTKSSGNTIGVQIHDDSHHNKILNNEMFNNGVMNKLTPDPSPDLGAWGMNLRGDDNEIAYNYIHDNNGVCAYDFSIQPGNAIELYNADRNLIHHNKVINDRVFSEVGHDGSHTANDNVWAYNIFISNTKTSRFLVLHGANSSFGPVLRSKAFNNSIYLYGPTSTGIGSSDNATIVKNNIVVATDQLTSSTEINQSNNIWWNPNGPAVVKKLGPGDRKIDPQFVNPTQGDLHLKATSPAINAGTTTGLSLSTDFDGNTVPVGTNYDIGAYEFTTGTTPSPSSSPTPTPTPTPSPTPSPTSTVAPTPTPTAAPCANDNLFTIVPSVNYTFSKGCLTIGSTIYSDDTRFTYFSLPSYLQNLPTVKTGNIAEKSDLNLNFGIRANSPVKVYLMYRKIPGQGVPTWITEKFTKITSESYENLPEFALRKNEQGLIGVYDIYEQKTRLVAGESLALGPASDTTHTAFSMYLVAIAPQQ